MDTQLQNYKFIPKAALSDKGKRFGKYKSERKSWVPWVILIVVGVIVVSMLWALTTKKEFKQTVQQQKVMENKDGKDRIFVSIASYRDPECGKTINSLYANADNPFSIDVGVCQQNRFSDEDCVEVYEGLAKAWAPMVYTDQIGVIRMNYKDAAGPCFAREQIEEKLYGGQTYFLQIDSHMRFSKGWDTFLIKELGATGDDKAILTGYPPERNLATTLNLGLQPATFLRPRFGDETMYPVFEGPSVVGIPMKPFPTLGWSGCFSFSRGELHRTVPYLKNVPYLFFGEEFTMSCLYFVFGYNFYAPTKMPCVTTFDREYRHTFWELKTSDRKELEEQSMNYIYNLLGFTYSKDEGTIKRTSKGPEVVRPLDQWLNLMGVDIEKRTLTPHGKAGVTPQPSEDEIITKYGSNTKFNYMLS